MEKLKFPGMNVNLELCTDGADGAELAARYGFKRIELCSALTEGGLTPSFGAIEVCSQFPIEVHAMIRPTAGGFNYPDWALEVMRKDILKARDAGASGVVFGVLDGKGTVADVNGELVELARSVHLETTFHRAFDLVGDPESAMKSIVSFGFDRVLTSGQKETAFTGIDLLEALHNEFGDRIQIMAGSGVGPSNALQFFHKGIRNLHFTSRKKLKADNSFQMGERWVSDPEKMKAVVALFS